MSWLLIATIGYLLIALEIVLDKFLLSSKKVSHPVIYAFYSGTLGLFALIFIPFGFHWIGLMEMFFRFFSGIVFIYGMLALFFAINKSEASRVMPVIGAVIPIVTYFLSWRFLGERLGLYETVGIAALISGGLIVSLDFSKKRKKVLFVGFYWSIAAGILLAISATIFKGFYNHDNFLNVYIWTRAGAFLGILIFFLVPQWRKIILSSLGKFRKPESDNKRSGLMFVLGKATGGTGSILKEKAASFALASVTIVNAMVSLEYVFIFILGLIFSMWLPNLFEEKKDLRTVAQKITAIIIITIGVVMVSGI